MKRPTAGGGFPAVWYTLAKAREAGGLVRMLRALTSKNACKTCALGMGGQRGGMVNEAGRFPEVCKKSVQAMAADMQGRIRSGFFEQFALTDLERLTPRELEAAGRIVQPLIAEPGATRYREASWDEAMDRVAHAMRATAPEEAFFYFSGRSSNEAAFLLQLVARAYGTNHVNNCSYFCHQASGVALAGVTGSGTATVTLEDLDLTDLVILIGGNPASNHPRFMRTLMDLKRRGGKVIVINPLKELGLVRFKVPSDPRSLFFGTAIADLYVQPHIGGDIALMTMIARILMERGELDTAFIDARTEGWSDVSRMLRSTSWETLEAASGVSPEDAEAVADSYAASKNTVFCWTMGMTHHSHGVDNVRMIANLAMMRGMLGRRGAGLLPLRGHSNVQGVGSMGVVPQLRGDVLAALERHLSQALPRTAGLDTLECLKRADDGGMRLAWCLGGNLYGSAPDATMAGRALRAIDTVVYMSTTLNTGHIHGRGKSTVILPVRTRDEESQPTTQESMFNYVRMSDGGEARLGGPRGEVEVISAIAQRVMEPGCAINFAELASHRAIRELIAAVIPGYEPVADIDRTRREFQIPGRTFHEPRFRTPTGRASFRAVPIPVRGIADDELMLATIRSEGQFNTVVYEEEDLYRGQDRRDVVLMNIEDMDRLGLVENDPVDVVSRVGRVRAMLARPFEIRSGNVAMYYPEANVLVPWSADTESRTPAFKSVPVRVSKSTLLPVLRTSTLDARERDAARDRKVANRVC